MINATVSFTPSTVSRPELQASVASLVQLGLMTSVPLVPYAQPEASTYQSGSPAASRNLSVARVCHGERPIAGKGQLLAPAPSFAPPTFPAASGQTKRPGSVSPALAACSATCPMRAALARASTSALRPRLAAVYSPGSAAMLRT